MCRASLECRFTGNLVSSVNKPVLKTEFMEPDQRILFMYNQTLSSITCRKQQASFEATLLFEGYVFCCEGAISLKEQFVRYSQS